MLHGKLGNTALYGSARPNAWVSTARDDASNTPADAADVAQAFQVGRGAGWKWRGDFFSGVVGSTGGGASQQLQLSAGLGQYVRCSRNGHADCVLAGEIVSAWCRCQESRWDCA